MENVRLQRQVQLPRDQVANSVAAQQRRKPISTNKSYSETRNNSSKQTIAIIGDSNSKIKAAKKQLDGKKLSNGEKIVNAEHSQGQQQIILKTIVSLLSKEDLIFA